MNYLDSTMFITHRHSNARLFNSEQDAQNVATELNLGKPEGLRAFRTEICLIKGCGKYHVRRGKNVMVKQELIP